MANHQIADPLTPFEESLRNIPLTCHEKSLNLLETLCKNTALHPKEDKYRKIRLSNDKIYEAITSVDPALEALLVSGWELEDADTLILPAEIEMDFQNVCVKNRFRRAVSKIQ